MVVEQRRPVVRGSREVGGTPASAGPESPSAGPPKNQQEPFSAIRYAEVAHRLQQQDRLLAGAGALPGRAAGLLPDIFRHRRAN